MDADALLDVLVREGAAMAAAADAAGLDAPVPSCPGWDVRQLLNHLGRVHRWATAMVRAGARERIDFPPRPPVIDTEWFAEGVAELVAALAEAGPAAPVWAFPGAEPTAAFWFRRQAVETAVHRWDAERAAGAPSAIDAALAVEGIDELFDVVLARHRVEGVGSTLHLHATDATGEWTVRAGEGGHLSVERGHAKGDAAVRATASDLLLWLWGRDVGAPRLELFGDETVVSEWKAAIGTR